MINSLTRGTRLFIVGAFAIAVFGIATFVVTRQTINADTDTVECLDQTESCIISTQPNVGVSRGTIHLLILSFDAIILLGLLIALSFRIAGKLLSPNTLASAPKPDVATATTSPSTRLKTIDELNIDIPV